MIINPLLLLLLFVFPGCWEQNIVSALASVQVLIICTSTHNAVWKCKPWALAGEKSGRDLVVINLPTNLSSTRLTSSRAQRNACALQLINRACSKAMSACEKCPPTGRLHLQRFEWNAISIFYILRYPQFVAQNLFKKVTNQRYIYVGTV